MYVHILEVNLRLGTLKMRSHSESRVVHIGGGQNQQKMLGES